MRLTREESAFIDDLYCKYAKNMYYYALSTMKNNALAEEAVQESFRIACVRVKDLMKNAHQFKWLMKTLSYVIKNINKVNYKSWQKIMYAVPIEELNISVEPEQESMLIFTEMCRKILTPEEFDLLNKISIQGRPIIDVSEEIGITPDACSKRYQRIKRKIEKNLKIF